MFLNALGTSEKRVRSALSETMVGVNDNNVKKRNPRPSRGFQWTLEDHNLLKTNLKTSLKPQGITVERIKKSLSFNLNSHDDKSL